MLRHPPTRLYRLIEDRLEGTLADYVAASRAQALSWRAMAEDIQERTGICVSHEILRLWFAHRLRVQVKVAL